MSLEGDIPLNVLILLSATLSLIGSSIIIGLPLIFHSLWENFFALRIIFFLSLVNFVDSINYMIGAVGELSSVSMQHITSWCVIQASLMQYLDVCSFLLMACFAHAMLKTVTTRTWKLSQQQNVWNRTMWCYHFFIWFPPLFPLVVLAATNSYGGADLWCWIGYHQWYQDAFRVVFFYIPLWLTMFVCFITYILVLWKSRKTHSKWLFIRVSSFLIVFLIISVPGTISRFHELITGDRHTYYGMMVVHAFLSPLQGFLNCIVYGLSMPVLLSHVQRLLERGRDAVTGRFEGGLLDEHIDLHLDHGGVGGDDGFMYDNLRTTSLYSSETS